MSCFASYSSCSRLYYFSRFPSMSKSRFSPPTSNVPFPLSVSPLIINLYSMWKLLPPTTRSAENVSSPSFSFRSWRGVSFWSGQLIVPVILSPSFLIVRVDVRFWSPILYSHFHVPTGSALPPCAPARPQSPSTNVAERIAFMIASKKWKKMAGGKLSDANRVHPLTAILGMPRTTVRMARQNAGSGVRPSHGRRNLRLVRARPERRPGGHPPKVRRLVASNTRRAVSHASLIGNCCLLPNVIHSVFNGRECPGTP